MVYNLTMTIAVVDDEDNVRRSVSAALEKEQFCVAQYKDGLDAWNAVNQFVPSAQNSFPSLFILDIMMPRMDGITLFKKIRMSFPKVPMMFLTSRDEEFDRVLGLELGADDYLCKPFSLRELIARVHVLLRRYETVGTPATEYSGQTISCGAFTVRPQQYTAQKNNVPLELTVTEFRLLENFVSHPDTVFTRDQLISCAYPDDTYLNDRAVDCHIKRLRKKIGAQTIETVYGMGYRFHADGALQKDEN